MEVVPKAPNELIGSPEYYLWRYNNYLERNPDKNSHSYYLSYGYKYAQRFQNETYSSLSKNGQIWEEEVMKNLQISMELQLEEWGENASEMESNADIFLDFAFDSHKKAYLNNSGTVPLEDLSAQDLIQIVATPNFSDIFSVRGIRQVSDISASLVKTWIATPTLLLKREVEFMWNAKTIETTLKQKVMREIINPNEQLPKSLQKVSSFPIIPTLTPFL